MHEIWKSTKPLSWTSPPLNQRGGGSSWTLVSVHCVQQHKIVHPALALFFDRFGQCVWKDHGSLTNQFHLCKAWVTTFCFWVWGWFRTTRLIKKFRFSCCIVGSAFWIFDCFENVFSHVEPFDQGTFARSRSSSLTDEGAAAFTWLQLCLGKGQKKFKIQNLVRRPKCAASKFGLAPTISTKS